MRHPRPSGGDPVATGAAAAVASAAVHAAFSYHLQLAPHLLLLGVSVAVVANRAALSSPFPGLAPAWARNGTLAVLLVHGVLLTAYGLTMPKHRTAYTLSSQSNLEYRAYPGDATVHRLEIATILQPHATEARLALASALWQRCRATDAADTCTGARDEAGIAVDRNRYSYEALYLRGKYGRDPDDVLVAIRMNPRFSAARVVASELLAERGDEAASFAVLRDGLRYLKRITVYDFDYLDRTEAAARAHGRLDIVDEVAVARGRVGRRMRDLGTATSE
jgi:hypothetical protein